MINEAKKRNIPAPNAYPASPLLGNIKHFDKKDDKQDKFCCFIDEAKWHAGNTVLSKNDIIYNQLDKKLRVARVYAESEKQKE